ncbi:MAG: transcription elongation factor GreA [Candidatus Firestonebacteria bacterium]|nr:transcription elongation factor GreA [Candidatus Firestonebacteria bacterium]
MQGELIMNDVILTKAGLEKLQKDLEYLKKTKRKEVSEALKEARAHGDLSENAEYDAAKQEQAVVEAKIAKLQEKLNKVRILENNKMPTDIIRIGAKVKVADCTTGEEEIYILVGEDEADFALNKISVHSPIAQGLAGHKIGETVEIKVPAGILKYEIKDIVWEYE